jgi:hypothetical protein
MSRLLPPFQLVLLVFSGWVNRHQLDVIEYLQEENRVLKERLGGRRIRFTDVERRRLARKAQLVGRKVLKELETLVTPDTPWRWYRELIASKWNYSHRRAPGRPRVMTSITDLVVQMALENPSWGYTRIRGMPDRHGLSERRGLHDQRPSHALCSILYQRRVPVRAHRWSHAASGQRLDGASRAQCHRFP